MLRHFRCRSFVFPVVFVLLWAACAKPRISQDELPEEPLAALYWNPDDARSRADILAAADEQPDPRRRRGVARPENFASLLGGRPTEPLDAQLRRYPGNMVLIDPGTQEVTEIEAAPRGARPLAWSPDHQRLLFVSAHIGGRYQLYVYDLPSGEVRALTYGSRSVRSGDFGPDDRIAYSTLEVVEGRPRGEIWVANSSGGKAQRIAKGFRAEGLRWTNDGAWLVYTRLSFEAPSAGGRERWPVLSSRAAEPGSEEHSLGRGRDPALTPDDQWIVYSAPLGGSDTTLRRVRPDGSARAPMSRRGRREKGPTISPDGRMVAFVVEADHIGRLWVRRFDGSGERSLLTSGGFESLVW